MSQKKSRVFIFSLKDPGQIKRVNDICDSQLLYGIRWARIVHDHDFNPETGEVVEPHTHYYIEYESPRTLTTVSNLFDIPVNMVQIAYDKMGSLKYLVHDNQPKKHHYNWEDVQANFDLMQVLKTEDRVDIIAEFEDYMKFKKGDMSYQDFLMSHNIPLTKLGYYSRIRIYDMMMR